MEGGREEETQPQKSEPKPERKQRQGIEATINTIIGSKINRRPKPIVETNGNVVVIPRPPFYSIVEGR